MRFLPCQIKSQVWKKGLHHPTSTPSSLPTPLLLSSSSSPSLCSLSLFLSINISLSPSSALNSHWCFFSSAVSIASWEGGRKGGREKRERWRYLLINLSWSWPPINQTDKKHWMAEQRRQAERVGRRSREVHSHKNAETHTGGHTHMLMRVYANKHADEPSQRTHYTQAL